MEEKKYGFVKNSKVIL